MRTLFTILGIVLIFVSCGKRQPKIDYNKESSTDSLTMDSIVADTSKILVAELPVYFDSTEYLIHPIGLISLNDWGNKRMIKSGSYSGSDYSNNEFSVESYREDNFSGNITNIVFENLKDRSQRLLTNKVLNISYVQYLRNLSKKINRHFILYSVIDKDYNHDGKLDYRDISSLYISKLDGTNFEKITKNFHDYIDGKLIIQDLKYYYRTIEDINRDGLFDAKDRYHYYYIDFSNDPYKIVEYNPLRLIEK